MTHKTYPLNQSPLFKLQSRKKLAEDILRVNLPSVEQLANASRNYHVYDVFHSHKVRHVEQPRSFLKRLHRRLYDLLKQIEKPAYLQSGVKGLSHVTNARLHANAAPLVKLDIRKFYPSIGQAMVFRFFHQQMQCSPDVSGLLAKLCTFEGHVPLGSCISQLLAYFSAKPMFDELACLAERQGVTFSCYVDDLVFSGAHATPSLLWMAKQVVHAHGLRYHHARCYRADQRKLVTGVMISGDRITVRPAVELNTRLREVAISSAGSAEERLDMIGRLMGNFASLAYVEPRFQAHLKRLRGLHWRARAAAARNGGPFTRTAHAETTPARLAVARGAGGRPKAAGRPGPGR